MATIVMNILTGMASSCYNMHNSSYVFIYLDNNTTLDTTEEDVIKFFPKIDAPLSGRVLFIEFSSNKTAAFQEHEKYLRDKLGFRYYESEYDTKCLERVESSVAYSFCYNVEDNNVDWTIVTKDFYDDLNKK
ncbi:MAG: hypothetical protein LBT96_04965 [Campylobacteraceae bacterium]|nr:hypothetical protein [Campylobacteraceae bacterium]